MFTKILFPLNQSRESQQAVKVAAAVSHQFGASVTILSVVASDLPAEAIDAIKGLQVKTQAVFRAEGVETNAEVVEGMQPALAICDVADEHNIDLIIMGSEGMVVAKEHPEGSVSQQVINLSPCPVLVVP